jgi:2-amino-4-hydroxy-6-hydroxymethyldihydropteridine diphosphokinase
LNKVFLSLGSNLGDREALLEKALGHLEAAGVHVVRRSTIHETEPQDLREQPWFLNLAVETKTDLSPEQLLALIQKIESEMGRQRVVPKGPRTIDIDILFYGDRIICAPDLEIPHPRLTQRTFVLNPLGEIAPDLRHPATGQTVRQMGAALEQREA